MHGKFIVIATALWVATIQSHFQIIKDGTHVFICNCQFMLKSSLAGLPENIHPPGENLTDLFQWQHLKKS